VRNVSDRKTGLGRGLGALIQDAAVPAAAPSGSPSGGPAQIPVAAIRASRFQPRRDFADGAMADLTESVRRHGVLQPLLLRRSGDAYELIAGERRLRAARAAGLAAVPAIVTDAGDSQSLEMTLVENLQREDLNPLEEAEGYRSLMERFGHTQERVAEQVGKARATVANALRLLSLPDVVRQMLGDGRIASGHAKVLLGLDGADEQGFYARLAVEESLSVRQLEKRIEKDRRTPRKPRAIRHDIPADHLAHLTNRLHQHFGTSVRLLPSRTYANGKKAKGCLEVDFYSNEELDRILQVLGLAVE
jgi:ParB family chromosome partitioning protein